jgi:hypothetical protein
MAQFSQAFLSNLGRPAYQQGMFGLGQAIGSLPGQRREQQKQQQLNQLMQQIQGAQGSGDFASMKILSQQLATIDPQQAAKVMQAATALEQQQGQQKAFEGLFTGKAQTPQAYMTAGQQALAAGDLKTALALREQAIALESTARQKETKRKATLTELQGFMQDPRVSKEDKLQVRNVLQGLTTGQTDVEAVEPQLDQFRDRFKPKAVGSRAAPQKVEVMEKQPDGSMKKVTKFALQDPVTGKLTYETVGPTPPKEFAPKDEKEDLGLDTKWGSDLLKEARTKAQEAAVKAANYDQLATEASKRAFYERGFFGKTLSATEEALGIAGAATTHRRRINEIRMSGALELLPTGPASDRDVALALDASIDPNNLSNEEAEAYLRGMAKIAKAEEEYYSRKTQFIQYTKDPNAVGFEDWVAKTQAQKTMDFYLERSPNIVAQVREKISLANRQVNPADREAALRALEQNEVIKPILDALENQSLSEERWEQTVLKNQKLRGLQ